MYLYHFGLRELPFTLTPNTSFYCGLQSHDEALDVLLLALQTGEGFIKVSGEVGTGKTLLCRKLLNELPDAFVAAYVPDSYLGPQELRRAIAAELGLQVALDAGQHALTDLLQQRLLQISAQGKTVVVLIDEAQVLSDDSFEALRLLSNLETESHKLLHIVLMGQPELEQRLASHQLRQLRQRITFSYRLRALSREEVGQYLHHRLQVAGYQGEPLFNVAAIRLLHKAGRGIPRLINVLAHKAMMLSFGRGEQTVTHRSVRAAVADTDDAWQPGFWSWRRQFR